MKTKRLLSPLIRILIYLGALTFSYSVHAQQIAHYDQQKNINSSYQEIEFGKRQKQTLGMLKLAQQTFQQGNQQQTAQPQNNQQQNNQQQLLNKIQEINNNLNSLLQQEWGKLNTNTPAPAIAPLITNPVQQLLMPNKPITPNQGNPAAVNPAPANTQSNTPTLPVNK